MNPSDPSQIPPHLLRELAQSIVQRQFAETQRLSDDNARQRLYDHKPFILPSNVRRRRAKLLMRGCAWLALVLFVVAFIVYALTK